MAEQSGSGNGSESKAVAKTTTVANALGLTQDSVIKVSPNMRILVEVGKDGKTIKGRFQYVDPKLGAVSAQSIDAVKGDKAAQRRMFMGAGPSAGIWHLVNANKRELFGAPAEQTAEMKQVETNLNLIFSRAPKADSMPTIELSALEVKSEQAKIAERAAGLAAGIAAGGGEQGNGQAAGGGATK